MSRFDHDVAGYGRLRWPCTRWTPLTRPQSVELVEKLTNAELAARYGDAIARNAAGLPVQIVPGSYYARL